MNSRRDIILDEWLERRRGKKNGEQLDGRSEQDYKKGVNRY